MAEVIRLSQRTALRETRRNKDAGETATILLFTGVRYEDLSEKFDNKAKKKKEHRKH